MGIWGRTATSFSPREAFADAVYAAVEVACNEGQGKSCQEKRPKHFGGMKEAM
jgi:hypothetical protein